MKPCTLRPQLSKFFSKTNLIYSFQKKPLSKNFLCCLIPPKTEPCTFQSKKIHPWKMSHASGNKNPAKNLCFRR